MDQRRAGGERGLGIDHRRQRLPGHAHLRAAVLGQGARGRHHRHHRLALPDGLVDGERVLRRRLHAGVVLQHADPGLAVRGHLAAGDDGDHARQRGCRRGVDGHDARVGVGRAHEGGVREARDGDVVGVGPAAGHEPRRLRPHDGASDVAVVGRPPRRPAWWGPRPGARPRATRPGRSRDSRCSGSSWRRAPRGWLAASGCGSRSSSAWAVSSMPEVQKPHCSAFSRTEGPLQLGERAGLRPAPRSSPPRQPSAWTASIRQPRTELAVDAHRARPAHPVLAADVRAGELQARRGGSRPGSAAARPRGSPRAPLTVRD